jgi:hypothetical protein
MNASERECTAEVIKNGNAENQPLTKKMTRFCKKVA